jgi:hypothetical protein
LAVLNDNFKVEGVQGRRKRLKAGWETVDTELPSYNQGHVKTMAKGMFPDLEGMFPNLVPPRTIQGGFQEMWELLDDGFALSIALMLPRVDATSPLRRYTDAPHQVLLVDKRTRDGEIEGLVIDPMAPLGDPTADKLSKYHGHWAPKRDIREAATNADPDTPGVTYVEPFPIGGWTARAQMHLQGTLQAQLSKPKAELIAERNELKKERDKLKSQRNKLGSERAALAATADALEVERDELAAAKDETIQELERQLDAAAVRIEACEAALRNCQEDDGSGGA